MNNKEIYNKTFLFKKEYKVSNTWLIPINTTLTVNFNGSILFDGGFLDSYYQTFFSNFLLKELKSDNPSEYIVEYTPY